MKYLVLILSAAIICSAKEFHDEDDFGNEVFEFWLNEGLSNTLEIKVHCDNSEITEDPEIIIRSWTKSGLEVNKFGESTVEETCSYVAFCDELCTDYFFDKLEEDSEAKVSVLIVGVEREHIYRFYLKIGLIQ